MNKELLHAVLGGAWEDGWNGWRYNKVKFIDWIRIELVQEHIPHEESYNPSFVFKVTEDDGEPRFFKKTGQFSSYDGINWNGKFAEVFPIEKVVYEYE